MKNLNKIRIFRFIILTLLLIVITIVAFQHQILGGGPKGAPSIHSLCPFGGLETIYKILAEKTFIKRTYISNFILLGGTIILTILLSRFFCGFLCVIGWLQEIFARIGQKIFKKRFEIPKIVDKPLRFLKYILLVIILFFTWKLGELVISPYDPFAAYAHIPAGINELLKDFLIGFIILILMLIFSFFYDRVFCKYLCPMGAFLGILNKITLFKIKRDTSTCIKCNKCSKACPANIDVTNLEVIKTSECINCMECVIVCPTQKDTIKTTFVGKYLKPFLIAIIGVSIYFGIIGITNIFGIWQTQESSLEKMVKKDGKLDPYLIRGFMTIKDISEIFNIKIDRLYKEFNLNKNVVPENTKIKELQKFNNQLTEEKIRDTIAYIINFKKEENQTNNISPEEIKGSMTLREVIKEFNLDKKEFYKRLNIDEKYSDEMTLKEIKEIKEKEGISFEIENIRLIVKEMIK
ncbi:MAG TPA: 4Fe-4S binding protein [Spirochaetota bacterium]|nr:4Fe-4S binding protein [Spirochaetota bacterium]HOL56122.1 4Fe-4S binding protein [Spirochaetota bacterium]HPP04069.1 4Fe-4S binding protein [Spirochaetota bacterium]